MKHDVSEAGFEIAPVLPFAGQNLPRYSATIQNFYLFIQRFLAKLRTMFF
jgi:hypothetical protein